MIYLDNAATTHPVYVTIPDMNNPVWLNANTNYAYNNKTIINDCINEIKTALKVKSGQIYFGGNASDIIYRIFDILAYTSEFVVSAYEHDCVYSWRSTEFKNPKDIESIIENNCDFCDNILICQQYVNNVTGGIFNIEPITKYVKEHKNTYFVCDLTASIGKVILPDFEDSGIDIAFWSGHKIGTKKGIGCVWISDRMMDILNYIQNNFDVLYGTPSIEDIIDITNATKNAMICYDEDITHYQNLIHQIVIQPSFGNTIVPVEDMYDADSYKMVSNYSSAILCLYLANINADALQQYLASKNIYIGLGASACAEDKDYRVLNAFGLSNEQAEHTIRISFSPDNKIEDIIMLMQEIENFKEQFIN